MFRFRALLQPILAAFALLASSIVGSTCARADSYTVSIDNSLALGNVMAATSGDTVFRIVPSGGAVSLVSGGGRRLSNALVRSLVTIHCDDNNNSGH